MKILFNKDINIKNLNKEVTLFGWIERIRKLGKISFINLRDSTGVIQLLIDDSILINNISKESVVKIKGIIKERKTINKDIINGDIEVHISDLQVLSKSSILPFEIETDQQINEELRIKHRYLDLRSKRMQDNMKVRHNVLLFMRNFFDKKNFLEIETPMLTKPTPEGANDFLIPTSHFDYPSFFALPQSPQMYKQLLMVSGIERYYQITKVFRDEDLRADRQLEFTQLDIEISFTTIKQIQNLIEDMMIKLFDHLKIKNKLIFEHMTYDFAMNNYGTDKPDLRYETKLKDITTYFENSSFNAFKNQKSVKFIFVEDIVNKNQIKIINEIAKKHNDTKVSIIAIEESIPKGQICKFISKELEIIIEEFDLKNGSLFMVADEDENVNISLGAIRVELNKIFNLAQSDKYKFVWIEDWPLFEYSTTENRFVSKHHPFTAPSKEYEIDIKSNYKEAKAKAYDLVLNGYEVAGGSIRISNIELQNDIFNILGISEDEKSNKFGFLLEAFKYGVPPHGGIAFGLDRLIMIIQKEKSIREVIAFPKNSKGFDSLIDAPCIIKKQR